MDRTVFVVVALLLPLLPGPAVAYKISALLLPLLPGPSLSYKILAFLPFNGRTHHTIYRPVLEALADRGHSVTYVTPHPSPQPHQGIREVVIEDCYPGFNSRFFFENSKRPFSFLQVSAVYGVTEDALMRVYSQPAVRELIASSESFDAVITETCFFQEAIAALHHRFGGVAIEICCLGERSSFNGLVGLPDNAAYMVDYRSPFTDKMTLWERIYNSFISLSIELTAHYHMTRMEELARTTLVYPGSESRPPLAQLLANLSLVLVNSHPALSYPYPTAPHVKRIAGVVMQSKSPPLSRDLQNFLDRSTDGVIFMSLGTNLEIVSEKRETFGDVAGTLIKVFGKLPQRILMKWDSDYSGQVPPNVRMSKWFPQQQILGHNKTVLFITHGGYSSVYEAAYCGVPIIGIPYFGDQPKNVLAAVAAGNGLRLDYDNVTEESLSSAIEEVLTNRRYREEAGRRSRILRDVRTSPAEDAVYWIEHVIKFPNYLTPRSAYMSYVELNMVDAKLILLSVCLALYCLVRRAFGTKTAVKVKTS